MVRTGLFFSNLRIDTISQWLFERYQTCLKPPVEWEIGLSECWIFYPQSSRVLESFAMVLWEAGSISRTVAQIRNTDTAWQWLICSKIRTQTRRGHFECRMHLYYRDMIWIHRKGEIDISIKLRTILWRYNSAISIYSVSYLNLWFTHDVWEYSVWVHRVLTVRESAYV